MSTQSPVTTCDICGLPYFSGVAGYAGQQCKCAFNNHPVGTSADLAARCMRLESELSATHREECEVRALYTASVIHADVTELTLRLDKTVEDYLAVQRENVELSRKLEAAEARIRALQEQEPRYGWAKLLGHAPVITRELEAAEAECQMWQVQLKGEREECDNSIKELTKLLSEAKSKAVPEGHRVVSDEILFGIVGSFGHGRAKNVAKLSALLGVSERESKPAFYAAPQQGGSNE